MNISSPHTFPRLGVFFTFNAGALNVISRRMELDAWRKLNAKEFASKMAEIVENYSKDIPDHLYLSMMNATKVLYDRLRADNAKPEREPLNLDMDARQLKFEIDGRRMELQFVKKSMNNFKPMSRVTNNLRTMAVESYCNHMKINIPVHTWECLSFYGHAARVPIPENEFYQFYKEHYNARMRRFAEMYKTEMELLDSLELHI